MCPNVDVIKTNMMTRDTTGCFLLVPTIYVRRVNLVRYCKVLILSGKNLLCESWVVCRPNFFNNYSSMCPNVDVIKTNMMTCDTTGCFLLVPTIYVRRVNHVRYCEVLIWPQKSSCVNLVRKSSHHKLDWRRFQRPLIALSPPMLLTDWTSLNWLWTRKRKFWIISFILGMLAFIQQNID